MRSWDIAVSVQTSSKPSNYCTKQNRLNKKKQNKPYSVTASVITLLLQQLSKMALLTLGTHCFLSGWYREMLQWIQDSWFVFKTKCCCIQIPYSFTNKAISILGVQRHLPGWGWQSYRTDSDVRGFQVGWFKAALRQKGLLHFKTIVAKLLWREKQTFACILEMGCSFQMAFHFPVSWCISIRYASVIILEKESFSSLWGFLLPTSPEKSHCL